MTDERMSDALWTALARLPRGSGVMFRHLATERRARVLLQTRVAAVARRRGLVLVDVLATRPCTVIAFAHSIPEAIAANRAGARAIFVSPVHPTRTHPGARTLGPIRAARIARSVPIPAIALGGMTAKRFARVRGFGFVGWAAIDGLSVAGDQKRKAVPM